MRNVQASPITPAKASTSAQPAHELAIARENRRSDGSELTGALRNKTILLVSPNSWGTMRVSKHHYALELAARGNRVFFLNPPDSSAKSRIDIAEVADVPGLNIVTYRPFFPYAIRFRSRSLFNVIASAHAKWLVKRIGRPLDIVWCFDVNLYSDLRWFGAPVRIFNPADQVVERFQRDVASTANLALSVSEEILQNVRSAGVPSFCIGHGLATAFAVRAESRLSENHYEPAQPLRVGYVGNLFIKYLDRETIRVLVRAHPDIEFHFWGPLSPAESNVGSADSPPSTELISFLQASPNVYLRGKQHPDVIAEQLQQMDVLLICYAVADDPNRGCNSHKILEYLSTGRVIVSNHVPDYAGRPDLIRMVPTPDNAPLASLFGETVRDVRSLNEPARQATRTSFALSNTYAKQLDRIEQLIEANVRTEGVVSSGSR